MTTFHPWLRATGVLLGLVLCLTTSGCGLAAAAAIAAIQDGLDGGDDDGDGGGGTPDPRPAVAVIHALPNAAHVSDVVDRLIMTETFESVASIDAAVATPTLVQLQAYDAVLVVADGAFLDAAALGDALAIYAEAGGGVVTATCARSEEPIGGAWAAGHYDAILAPGVLAGDGPVAWVADIVSHPILAGLVLAGSGTGSDRPDVATVTTGSTLVASWATGEPLVAVRLTTTGARLVTLGFHVVTDSVDPSFVDDASDAKTIVVRALRWAAFEI